MSARLDGFGLVVEDMAGTLAFYRLLGLDIPAEADGEGHIEIDLGGGNRFMLDTVEVVRSFDDTWQVPQGRGRLGLAVRCDSPAEVDGTYQRLIAAGYGAHRQPWDAFWGQRYAGVVDPNGVVVDLYAPLA
jgi:uncharacterized glyoxalase superfamily protein PhnB